MFLTLSSIWCYQFWCCVVCWFLWFFLGKNRMRVLGSGVRRRWSWIGIVWFCFRGIFIVQRIEVCFGWGICVRRCVGVGRKVWGGCYCSVCDRFWFLSFFLWVWWLWECLTRAGFGCGRWVWQVNRLMCFASVWVMSGAGALLLNRDVFASNYITMRSRRFNFIVGHLRLGGLFLILILRFVFYFVE